jgi:hypothetical protein
MLFLLPCNGRCAERVEGTESTQNTVLTQRRRDAHTRVTLVQREIKAKRKKAERQQAITEIPNYPSPRPQFQSSTALLGSNKGNPPK